MRRLKKQSDLEVGRDARALWVASGGRHSGVSAWGAGSLGLEQQGSPLELQLSNGVRSIHGTCVLIVTM